MEPLEDTTWKHGRTPHGFKPCVMGKATIAKELLDQNESSVRRGAKWEEASIHLSVRKRRRGREERKRKIEREERKREKSRGRRLRN